MTSIRQKTRFKELDALRGLAVLAMVIYHAVFDLVFVVGFQIRILAHWEVWRVLGIFIAGTFLIVVGISLYLQRQQQLMGTVVGHWWKPFLIRGVTILGLGLLVTFFTWLISPAWTVWFGILQLIGVSIIVSIPFITKKNIAWLGLLVITIGLLMPIMIGHQTTKVLIPFGIYPAGWQSFDYFPLFPWWGLVLIGIGLGQRWYADGQRHWHIPGWLQSALEKRGFLFVLWLGKHALLIYMVHQPLLLLLFYLLFSYRL